MRKVETPAKHSTKFRTNRNTRPRANRGLFYWDAGRVPPGGRCPEGDARGRCPRTMPEDDDARTMIIDPEKKDHYRIV